MFSITTAPSQTNMWKKGLVLEAIRIDLKETPSGMQIRLNDDLKSAEELNEYLEKFPASRKPICVVLNVEENVAAGQIANTMDKLCDTGFNYPMLIIKRAKHSHLVNLGGADEYIETTH